MEEILRGLLMFNCCKPLVNMLSYDIHTALSPCEFENDFPSQGFEQGMIK